MLKVPNDLQRPANLMPRHNTNVVLISFLFKDAQEWILGFSITQNSMRITSVFLRLWLGNEGSLLALHYHIHALHLAVLSPPCVQRVSNKGAWPFIKSWSSKTWKRSLRWTAVCECLRAWVPLFIYLTNTCRDFNLCQALFEALSMTF